MGMATAAGAQATTGTEIAQTSTEDEGDDSGKYGGPVFLVSSVSPARSSVTAMMTTAALAPIDDAAGRCDGAELARDHR